ncbi:unnamed protein product [Hyaloperonospora brassicae]|uniref:RRM domain-containing protein n=1 Tax=Hyaloperonospora brassicae TaxID=162125 RepID=A0AAV0TIE9_HYABA|nr:unnamed protein product [Hyaloperonospora brassicae]
MAYKPAGKSQRKRLQRQLEFYLSESNLRQDKFLQQAMDDDGFVPAHVFLSFNKLKVLKATESMIMEEADKSSVLRVDRSTSCIAPNRMPKEIDHDDDINTRTIYIENVSATDDHDSLRRVFAVFGRVNLVSLPRFSHNRKFKGFGFVEFADVLAADKAVVSSSVLNQRGIRVMRKTRWLDMKEQLKHQLAHDDVANMRGGTKGNSPSNTADTEAKEKKGHSSDSKHRFFVEGDVNEEATESGRTTKKQKV